jgi:hypothetical protein
MYGKMAAPATPACGAIYLRRSPEPAGLRKGGWQVRNRWVAYVVHRKLLDRPHHISHDTAIVRARMGTEACMGDLRPVYLPGSVFHDVGHLRLNGDSNFRSLGPETPHANQTRGLMKRTT